MKPATLTRARPEPVAAEPGPAPGLSRSDLALLVLQLALVGAVAWIYRVQQEYGFMRLLPLVMGGFVAHALMPVRHRRAFFLALSLAAIALVLPVPQAIGVIACGAGLLALCHLPVGFGIRVAAVSGAGLGLAAIRVGWIPAPWPSVASIVIPVLATLLMFRLIVYLYDLRHERVPASWTERLGYFFLLPNVCFPLFPVVDYRTYQRSYYDAAEGAIYQKGIAWMLRGILHILLYRIVYHNLVLAPRAVSDVWDVAQYAVSLWLIYMRVSGMFHLAIGILCLYGFNLPATNHLYFLASSFTDLWRRANIYWKDFMAKVFYYPAFARLKGRLPLVAASLAATAGVVVVTWALHSYQWFWLQGRFPVRTVDLLFWGVLGVGMIANIWREMVSSRRARLGQPSFAWRRAASVSLRTVAMFVTMSLLWSYWTSASFQDWWGVVSQAANGAASDYAGLAALLAAAVLAGIAIQYLTSRGWQPLWGRGMPGAHARPMVLGCTVALLVLASPWVRPRPDSPLAVAVTSASYTGPNAVDRELRVRGYYEGILDTQGVTGLTFGEPSLPDWIPISETDAARPTRDPRRFELRPDYAGSYKRARFTTNRWGMRDQDYELEPAPGTLRIALLGSSYTMGSGVSDDEVYDRALEARLNRERTLAPWERVEILNFAVGGYSSVDNQVLLQAKALDFSPDVVLFELNSATYIHLRATLKSAVEEDYEHRLVELDERLRALGAPPGSRWRDAERRVERELDELLLWSYRSLVELSERAGAVPLAVYAPQTVEGADEIRIGARVVELARAAGFHGVLDLSDAFAGERPEDLRVAPWDDHPNARAHALVAERLYEAIVAERELLLEVSR